MGRPVNRMTITRQQFLRAMEATHDYRDFTQRVQGAFTAYGVNAPDGLGAEKIFDEIVMQLEERCNDPVVGFGGSNIGWLLWEGGGPVTEEDGRIFDVTSPEALWDWWKATKRGPFAE